MDGQEAVAAPFRYSLQLAAGGKTHCLRPNALECQDIMNVKHQFLGQVFKGNFNRITSNKRAALVWEART